MSYDPCEKVFSIPGLRLIILSYSLDRIKKKKEIKPFFHRKNKSLTAKISHHKNAQKRATSLWFFSLFPPKKIETKSS